MKDSRYKFRGMRVDGKGWVYGFYVYRPDGAHLIYWQPFEESSQNTYHEIIPKSVGQFTGLCDKNGKEIYEGDIVRFLDDELCISSIGFDLGAFGITCWHGQKFPRWETFNNHGFNSDEFEIIGNIHENPELLK